MQPASKRRGRRYGGVQLEAEDRLPLAHERVRQCANAVTWAECQAPLSAALAEFDRAKARVAELRSLLSAFYVVAPPMNDGPAASALHHAMSYAPIDMRPTPTAAETAWRAAIEALQHDATTKVPA